MKEETRHTGECEGRESPLRIYTHGIPPGSLQDLFSHCLQKYGTETETETDRGGEGERKREGTQGGRRRKERQHNAHEDRKTLSPPYIPSQTPSEATEILDAPLCFWLLERVKIPTCKTLSEREGSLKMFRKRRTARIT